MNQLRSDLADKAGSREVPSAPASGNWKPPITARQREVLSLVSDGHSNKEIATLLRISPLTVRDHVSALLAAFGVRSRVRLALACRRTQTHF